METFPFASSQLVKKAMLAIWVSAGTPVEKNIKYYDCCPEPYPDLKSHSLLILSYVGESESCRIALVSKILLPFLSLFVAHLLL